MSAQGLRLGIISRWQAAKTRPDAMISIVDPGEAPPATAPHHLVLEMHDLDAPEPTRPDLVTPNRDHARQIIAFAREVGTLAQARPTTLVIHCSAGISRSPAAAMGVLATLHPDRGHEWARLRVQQLTQGTAMPNAALIEHLGNELGWQRRRPTARSPRPNRTAPDQAGR